MSFTLPSMESGMSTFSGLCDDGYGYEDRISSLPEDIRCHILSFLPTKSSVRTSVLSQNWRHVWRFVQTIHVNDNHITPRIARFGAVVNQLLLDLDNPVIGNIYLETYYVNDLFTINSWIQAAIARQVRQLNIHFLVCIPYDTILSLCSCQSLEVLKICGEIDVRDDALALFFPRLKVLHLRDISPAAMQTIYSGCPVLEELLLNGMLCFSDTTSYIIFIPTLKRLRVRFLKTGDRNRQLLCKKSFQCEFRIATPALETLNIVGPDLFYKLLVDMPFLRKVTVDLQCSDSVIVYTPFLELLKAMHNVHSMCLSPRTVYLLGNLYDMNLPTFHKLTHLEVQILDEFDCQMVINLIKGMPNLYSFILNKEVWDPRFSRLPPEEFRVEHMHTNAIEHDKIIEILGFNGQKDEQVVMSYLSKHRAIQD